MGIIKNISYAVTSNLVNLLVSLFTSLIIPRFIGVESFAFWQLYLFYSLYIGVLHFGWNDGIYLRYGGKKMSELNGILFRDQFISLFIVQLIFAGILVFIAFDLKVNVNRSYVVGMVALNIILTNLRWMLIYIFQATNQIKEYAKVLIIERGIYGVFLACIILFGYKGFKLLLWADAAGKLVSLLFALFFCRELIFKNKGFYQFRFDEIFKNIKVGVKLMIANLASNFTIGVVRLGIERTWDVITFGKISLTISAANLMIVFINSVGIVLFPMLKQLETNKQSQVYMLIRSFISPILLLLLLVYFPLKEVLLIWLPKYSDSLQYLTFVFPMFVFEAKMALLINTYLKALRKEKWLLKFNLLSLFISGLLTVTFTLIYKNLDLLMSSIVFVIAFRAIISELYLASQLRINVGKQIILECLFVFVFTVLTWFFNNTLLNSLLSIIIVLNFVMNRDKVTGAFRLINGKTKNN